MKLKKKTTLLIFSFVLIFSNLEAFVKFKGFEFWTEQSIVTQVLDDCHLALKTGFRWKDNASCLYRRYGEIGLIYHYNKQWTIIPSYRQNSKKTDHHWRLEANPRLTFIRQWEAENFHFSNRSRFEFKTNPDHTVYRNLLLLEIPLLFPYEIKPYLSEEFFLKKLTSFTENRLKIGFKVKATQFLNSDLGYMFRLKRDGRDWYGYHVIFCDVHFKF